MTSRCLFFHAWFWSFESSLFCSCSTWLNLYQFCQIKSTMVSLIFLVVFSFFTRFHFQSSTFPSLYFVQLSGFLFGPSWVGVHPYVCSRPPDHQEDSGSWPRPLYSCLIIHVLLLTSWISCQFDFPPTRSQSRSCWDINLPHSFATKIVTVPINNKGIGFFHILLPIKSAPASTCKAAVFKACLMVQTIVLTELIWQRGGGSLKAYLKHLYYFTWTQKLFIKKCLLTSAFWGACLPRHSRLTDKIVIWL